MAFDTDRHPDDEWGSALLLDRPKASKATRIGSMSVGAAAMSGLRHPDDDWIRDQPAPFADTDPAPATPDKDRAAHEPRPFESAIKRLNDLINSITANLSSHPKAAPGADSGERSHRMDAESNALDAWLSNTQTSRPTVPPLSRAGSGSSGRILADLFGDLLPETSPNPHADGVVGGQDGVDLDPLEWRARARAGEWVHDLPIFRSSEIADAVDRLARLLIVHQSGAAHTRIRDLITDGLTLAQIEETAALKAFFDDEAKLCLLRRFDQQQRCWTTYQGGSGLSWKLAARLLSVASLERLQEVLDVTWKDEWLHLPPQLMSWDTELSHAFRSYLRYLAIRKRVKNVVKANRNQLRGEVGDPYDHPSDEPMFRAGLPSATTSDHTLPLTPTSVWVSNERPARPI